MQATARPPIAYKNISLLRGMAMLMVALNHSASTAIGFILCSGNAAATPRLGDILVEESFQSITPLCLSMFLFASGYYAVRFHHQWASALASAKTAAGRYLLWSIPAYAIMAVVHRHFDLLQILRGLLTTGPFEAYWFLVMFIELTLITPLLSRLTTRSPWMALALAIVAQGFSCFSFYRHISGGPAILGSHNLVYHISPFLLGMLFSSNSGAIMSRLEKRRIWLITGAVFFFALSLFETNALNRAYGAGATGLDSYDVGRSSFVFFWLFAIAVIVTAPQKYPRLRSYLDWLGARSLALLLMLDPIVSLAAKALWHANDLLQFKIQRSTTPPVWTQGMWTTVPLFVAGLLIPLLTVELVGHWAGKNAKKFIFG